MNGVANGNRVDQPKVLLIAESANPEWTSVPLVGWSHALALSRATDAHLVTQIRNRDAIERFGWRDGVEFTAIDSEAIARPAHRIGQILRGGKNKGWTTTMAIKAVTYRYFERLVWKRFGARIRSGEFDVVHRLTPLSPTVPSTLAGRCRRAGIPFIWGPINGGVPWPRGFDSVRRQEREWLSYVRGLYKVIPGFRATRKNSTAIIIGSLDTWRQMPAKYHDKCVYVPENAIDPDRFADRANHDQTGPLRVAFIGRLVPYKGADMLIEAAAPLVRDGRIVVDIFGDGPQMPALRELVEREQVGDGISLAGAVPHAEVGKSLSASRVLGFPSVREFGGGVVLEAMALEMTPIVINYGGPGELVTDETGYRIPMGTRSFIVEQLREKLAALADNPSRLADLGRASRERIESLYTWSQKATQSLEIYRWAMGSTKDKPVFPFGVDTGQRPKLA